MYLILFNPKSITDTKKAALKLKHKLEKKKEEAEVHDIFEYDGKYDLLINKTPVTDKVVLVGGDGTVHHFINYIRNKEIRHRFFLLTAGSGNDYSRGHKGKFFEITDEIKRLPTVKTKEKTISFINGFGTGIDAAVCAAQAANSKNAIKESYYKIAKKTFKSFQKFKIKYNIDGEIVKYDDVWFTVIQNGKYIGGGMKVAPKAKRDDNHLDIVIVRHLPRWRLLLIFPLIFLGMHKVSKYIEFRTGTHIELETTGYNNIQVDGEVTLNCNKFIIDN